MTWGIEVGVIGLAAGPGRGSQPGELGGPESDIAGVLAISVARVCGRSPVTWLLGRMRLWLPVQKGGADGTRDAFA